MGTGVLALERRNLFGTGRDAESQITRVQHGRVVVGDSLVGTNSKEVKLRRAVFRPFAHCLLEQRQRRH
jgi:hypothetical protein